MIRITRNSDNTLCVQSIGLKIDLSPVQLFKQMINNGAQTLLDTMIEAAYKDLLYAFDSFVETIPGVLTGSPIHYEVIQELADFSRHILPLHSDSEMIGLDIAQTFARDSAFGIWKYNRMYDFMSTTSVDLPLRSERKITFDIEEIAILKGSDEPCKVTIVSMLGKETTDLNEKDWYEIKFENGKTDGVCVDNLIKIIK